MVGLEEEFEEVIENPVKDVPSYASAAGKGSHQRMNNEPSNGTRLRRQSTLVFGVAKTGKYDTEELLAADANLVASGVSKDVTCEQLKEFIINKGITVTDIELISLAPERKTNTF
jgi:hypothetical protein